MISRVCCRIALLILPPFFLAFTSSNAQEPATNIRVPEWVDFQKTQEKIVEQNTKMLGDLADVRNNLRQINIKLIEIGSTTQQAAATAGRDVHCDALKTKYDSRVEYTVVVLALVGVYNIVTGAKNFFSSNKKDSV